MAEREREERKNKTGTTTVSGKHKTKPTLKLTLNAGDLDSKKVLFTFI